MCTDVETKTSSLLVQYVILQQNRKKLPAQPWIQVWMSQEKTLENDLGRRMHSYKKLLNISKATLVTRMWNRLEKLDGVLLPQSSKKVIFHQVANRSHDGRNCPKSSCEVKWQAAAQSSISKTISLNDSILQNLLWSSSKFCSHGSAWLWYCVRFRETLRALVFPGAMLARRAGWPQREEKCFSAREAQGETELWNSRIKSQKSSWSQGGRICPDFVCISNTFRGQKSPGNTFCHLYSLICKARPMLGNGFPMFGADNNMGHIIKCGNLTVSARSYC